MRFRGRGGTWKFPHKTEEGGTWGKHGFPHGSEPKASDAHPFNAPSCSPRMYQRWTTMNAIRPGRIATTYIAAMVGQSHWPKPAFADASTTVSGRCSWSFVSVFASSHSPHAAMKL